jgi:Domain of unknown function (DUF4328)
MTESKTTHQQIGLERTRNYFYLTLGSLGASLLSNIIQFPYLVELLKLNRKLAQVFSAGVSSDTDSYLKSINSLTNSADIFALQARYGGLMAIGSLLSLVGVVGAIAAAVFLALAVAKYYRYYANQADNVSRNTVSGAVWGIFIPILNFWRPFFNLSEGLDNENLNRFNPKVKVLAYTVYGFIAYGIISSIILNLLPAELFILQSFVTSAAAAFIAFQYKNILTEIFHLQSANQGIEEKSSTK